MPTVPLPTRRAALAGLGLLAMPSVPRAASGGLRIVFGDFPPFTTTDRARPGIVNEVAVELLRMLGRRAELVPMPWAEAQAAARATPGTLITPLARTPAREPHFAWLVQVIDFESAIGTLAPHPPLDLAAARGVARLGVIAGSYHEGFLREQGFANLVQVPLAERMEALSAGRVDAFYTQSLELRWLARAAGRAAALRLGPRVQNLSCYIAAGVSGAGVPVGELREAFAAVEGDGTIERIVAAYIG